MKTTVFENDLLALVFNGTAIALIADNAATTPLANLFISLHTSDPGVAGNQSSNETQYTGYARVSVPRDNTGFVVANGVVSLADTVEFGVPTVIPAGSEVARFFGIGTLVSGSGKLLYKGALAPPITLVLNVPPRMDNAPPPSSPETNWDN